jgi:V/A-type H+-transporting ATPase subunit E
VSKEVRDEEFLRQLLLAIVGSAAEKIPSDQAVEVLIPENVLQSTARGRTAVTDEGQARLRNFVHSGTKDMLREGVELQASSELSGGIKVKMVGEDVVFDFSEKALSNLILKHLLPRYRAIMEGVE